MTVYTVSTVPGLLDYVVAICTVLAIGIAVASFMYTASESRKSRERAAQERQRQFDLTTLAKILDMTLDLRAQLGQPNGSIIAVTEVLSPLVRSRLRDTRRLFATDPLERDKLVADIQSRIQEPGNVATTPLGGWQYEKRLDSEGNFVGWYSVSEHITAEITNAIREVALQPLA